MPLLPPAALFNDSSVRVRLHAPKLVGLLLGALAFFVFRHGAWPGPKGYAFGVALVLALWWWRGRDGLTGMGVALQILQSLLCVWLGWLLAMAFQVMLLPR